MPAAVKSAGPVLKILFRSNALYHGDGFRVIPFNSQKSRLVVVVVVVVIVVVEVVEVVVVVEANNI